MKLTLSKYAGFCSGVRNADELIKNAHATGKKIYTLGKLIHNRIYNENLEKL